MLAYSDLAMLLQRKGTTKPWMAILSFNVVWTLHVRDAIVQTDFPKERLVTSITKVEVAMMVVQRRFVLSILQISCIFRPWCGYKPKMVMADTDNRVDFVAG